jgi:methionyl-tRNA formyltransferase
LANRRIIFAGSGEFGLPSLRAMIASGDQLVQVITQPDRPAGRGRSFTPTPIGQAAADAGLPLLKTGDINEETLPEADVMVVIAFGQKIADKIVNHPRLGSINLHASLLPKYRGAAPINWAIIRGETVTGNSIIRLAQRMDAGAVLAQSNTAIGPLETAGELHDRLSLDGAPLLIQTLTDLSAGVAVENPQNELLATLSPKLTRETAALDFTRPAAELAAKIRGLYPWPACRVILKDAAGGEVARMRLVRARSAHDDEGSRWEPGEVMLSSMIRTPDGALEIIELQPEGGRPMALADYRRGHRWDPGLKLIPG